MAAHLDCVFLMSLPWVSSACLFFVNLSRCVCFSLSLSAVLSQSLLSVCLSLHLYLGLFLSPDVTLSLSSSICPSPLSLSPLPRLCVSVLGVPPPQLHSPCPHNHCPPTALATHNLVPCPPRASRGPQSPTWLHLPCLQRPLGCVAPAWVPRFLSHRPGVRAGRNFAWPLPRTSAVTSGARRDLPHRPQLPLQTLK